MGTNQPWSLIPQVAPHHEPSCEGLTLTICVKTVTELHNMEVHPLKMVSTSLSSEASKMDHLTVNRRFSVLETGVLDQRWEGPSRASLWWYHDDFGEVVLLFCDGSINADMRSIFRATYAAFKTTTRNHICIHYKGMAEEEVGSDTGLTSQREF